MVGTPLTFDNPLEYYWAHESTQCEWMIRCDACNTWAEGLADDNIGRNHLVCAKCGKPLNPFGHMDSSGIRQGAGWHRLGPVRAQMEGFRIPQLLLPYSFSYNPEIFARKWLELLNKQRTYPRQKFLNEVVGVSYDSGDKPITRGQLRRACTEQYSLMDLSNKDNRPPVYLTNGNVFCGIDWGTGDPSKTLLTACRYNDHVFECFYATEMAKEFLDPEQCIPEIIRLLKVLNATVVGVDWGLGYGLNSRLRDAMGQNKVLVFCHTDQREKLNFDPSASVFTTNRSAVLTDTFSLLRTGGMRFRFSWDDLQNYGFAQDFTNVHKQVSRVGHLQYQHPPRTTDDTLHSLTFAFLASQSIFPRPDLV
jgi:hypothetical protein